MRTINYTQDMAESTNTLFVNNAMSTGRENGLNKAYLYGKQAQVQYINLEWTNEIGKKMWHKVYTIVAPPLPGETMRDELYLDHANFSI
jgi:hypothetical protein